MNEELKEQLNEILVYAVKAGVATVVVVLIKKWEKILEQWIKDTSSEEEVMEIKQTLFENSVKKVFKNLGFIKTQENLNLK